MVRCSVLCCNSDSGRKDENITFHRFPKELAIRTLWMTAISRPNWNPTTYSRVCSKHFEAHCFQKTEKFTMLRPNSIPNRLLQGKSKMKLKATAFQTDKQHEENSKELLVQGRSMEAEAINVPNTENENDSPRVKKLKEDIFLLRKKSKEDGIKIKCLQNKIRRVLRKQGNGKETVKKRRCQALKLRRSTISDEESSDSLASDPLSPSTSDDFNLEVNLQEEEFNGVNEPMAKISTVVGLSGLEEDLIEAIKTEVEDDPLTQVATNCFESI